MVPTGDFATSTGVLVVDPSLPLPPQPPASSDRTSDVTASIGSRFILPAPPPRSLPAAYSRPARAVLSSGVIAGAALWLSAGRAGRGARGRTAAVAVPRRARAVAAGAGRRAAVPARLGEV